MTLQKELNPWRGVRFRIFASGALVNNTGESMYAFALPLLALNYTGSLATMTLLVAIPALMLTIGGPLFGYVVDRFGSRVLVVPGLVLQLAAVLALNVVLLGDQAPLWTLYVAQTLVSVGSVSYRAGWAAGIPAMFPESPGRARGSLFMLFQVSMVSGPALSAMLVNTIGFQGLLWLNTVTIIAPLVIWFSGINPVLGQRKNRAEPSSVFSSLREGVLVFTQSSKMSALLIVVFPTTLVFSVATTTLFVFYATTQMGATPGQVAVSLAIANAGGMLAAFLTSELPLWRMRAVAFISIASAIGCLVVIAFGPNLIIATVALMFFYACDSFLTVAVEMEIFSSIPTGLIGRVHGIWRLTIGLPAFVAPVAISAVSEAVSPQLIFVMLALIMVVPLLWMSLRRSALRGDKE